MVLSGMDWGRLAAGALRGVVGAMSMTGYRTLAAEFGLLDQGTPPDRMADEAIPKLMAAVPEPVRPAVVDLLHLGYRAFGGVVYAAVPQRLRRHWASGPVYGMALWLGYTPGSSRCFGCIPIAAAARTRWPCWPLTTCCMAW